MKKFYFAIILSCLIFVGCKPKPELPKVTTISVDSITDASAFCTGEVVDNGNADITAKGFCWSIMQNPTLGDNVVASDDYFTATLSELTAATKYYVRAFATNIEGTAYGNEINFTTLEKVEDDNTGDDNEENSGDDNIGNEDNEEDTGDDNTGNDNTEGDDNNEGGDDNTGDDNEENSGDDNTGNDNTEGDDNTSDDNNEEKPSNNKVITVNGVSFTMVYVENGIFEMGAQSVNPSEPNYDSEAWEREGPVHLVTLSDYYIGETEVTQELWQAVMGNNPSHFVGGQKPVEQITWYDCKTFISRLNQLTGMKFRLPTEAEWEFAAKGGNESQGYKYSGSDNIDDVAWYSADGKKTRDVKTKSPNELGVYDMCGNVMEWCQDLFGDYSSAPQTNPKGSLSGTDNIVRGGCCLSNATYCRMTIRSFFNPGGMSYGIGFRLAL